MNKEKIGPEEYIAQWKARLAREKEVRRDGTTSVVIFRLAANWLALPTAVFREVIEPRVIRKIPHRSNDFLLGLVNVRGRLHLCVHLPNLLKLPMEVSKTSNRAAFARMVVIEKQGSAWVFPVDEIHSLFRFSTQDLVPFSDTQKTSRGILEWQGKTVDLLDENLLFQKIDGSLE